jgi:DNA-directed RNA polymerase subunit K/omega
MKSRLDSRGPKIDTERCVQQAGGRYDLILASAQRLREMKRVHRDDPNRTVTCVDALLEVQEGHVPVVDYLLKVK